MFTMRIELGGGNLWGNDKNSSVKPAKNEIKQQIEFNFAEELKRMKNGDD